ncbi:porin [Vibrio fortis]|uniref:porin n=1 Tax=Vibrio fortis TaxID=212667 RepID=UPI0036F2FD45
MKKTLLALTIAAASTSAFANVGLENAKPTFEFDPMHKEQFSVSGAVGVGGYYDTKTNAMYDDWATALTLAVSYQNNRLVGYFETDFEFNWTTDDKDNGFGVKNEFNTDVDKAWLGYETDYGVLSFGWENDTALDKVDGAGDNTYEFGSSAGDASDAFNVVKFQGATSGFAYGVSYFETGDDHDTADKGVNGYVGFEHEIFNVYAGYETRDKRDEQDYDVISLSGNAKLGEFTVGVNYWINDGNTKALGHTDYIAGKEVTGYYLSGSYPVSDQLTLAAGYNANSQTADSAANEKDTSSVNIAAMYTLNDRVDMGIDILQELDADTRDEETYVFAAAFYSF